MAPPFSIFSSCSSASAEHLSKFHAGQYDVNDNNKYIDKRDNQHRTFWRRIQLLVGYECNSNGYGLYNCESRRAVSIRDNHTSRWNHRNGEHHPISNPRFGYYIAVGLLAIGCFLPSEVKAEGDAAPKVDVIANPIATTTGQATNQAIQINQGGYSEQSFSPGHSCNSSTLTVSPFYIGSDAHPLYSRNQNFGIQATLSFPLDGNMVELCKSLAEKRLEKERLDYALIRALKCAELLKKGFMFHPDSQFSVVCSDVVPIALSPKSVEVLSREP